MDGGPDVTGEPAPEAAGTEWRPWTIPNFITLLRLACIPLFLYVLFGRDDRAWAAWLLGALGATDWVDGYLARRLDQVSELGKILDPTADRLMLLVGIFAIVVDGSVPVWIAVLVLTREALVAVLAVVLAAAGAARIDVSRAGKVSTFLVMWAFPAFLMSESTIGGAAAFGVLAWVCIVPGLPLHWYSAAGYVPLARDALARGRGSV